MGTDLKFKHALFGVGIFLLIVGVVFGVFNSGGGVQSSDILESLSYGFTSVFFALFAGVMIGVGATLITTGLVLGLRGNFTHITMSFLLSILSTLVAVAAIAEAASSTFPTLVLFFAAMASSSAFMLATVVFILSDAVRSYLAKNK